MMKSTTILFASIVLLLTNCAGINISNKTVEASGPDVVGTIQVKDVAEIEANQAIVVNYTVGTPVSVDYTVPESLAPYLKVTNKKGQLKCSFNGINPKLSGRKVVVNVTAPSIHEFEASSAATINVNGSLSVNNLDIEASSASTVTIAAVTANSTDIDASSSGKVNIGDLTTKTVDIDASSSAAVKVGGTLGKANIDASSAASVKISGACDVLNLDASSAASFDASKAKISTGTIDASSGASVTVTKPTGAPYKIDKRSGASINIR